MLFFCKWCYTNLMTNSRIQMSQTLTKIEIIAKPTVKLVNNTKSKIFWNLNGTVQFIFRFGNEIEQYYCQELWFACINTCSLFFPSLKIENSLKKYVQNFAELKYGFVKLVVIFLLFTRCDLLKISKNLMFRTITSLI